jgi:hypothetical protein
MGIWMGGDIFVPVAFFARARVFEDMAYTQPVVCLHTTCSFCHLASFRDLQSPPVASPSPKGPQSGDKRPA